MFLLPPSIELLLAAATSAATVIKSHYPWTIVAIAKSLDTEKRGMGLYWGIFHGRVCTTNTTESSSQLVVEPAS